MRISVLSVGGSIIAPDKVNSAFLSDFLAKIRTYLERNPQDKLIFVCGGGAPARVYQQAYREVISDAKSQDANAQDWIGIKATHINAELVKAIFGSYCLDSVVTNPTAEDVSFSGRILVAGGWKPGFSTDTDAVYLAKRFGAKLVINLSNIAKVYTDDPRKNPDAKPIDSISWADFRAMVGDEWVPGKNAPFDPIASRLAQEASIRVICADGRNTDNTLAILNGETFEGTVIGD
jgi:uridylate kinase